MHDRVALDGFPQTGGDDLQGSVWVGHVHRRPQFVDDAIFRDVVRRFVRQQGKEGALTSAGNTDTLTDGVDDLEGSEQTDVHSVEDCNRRVDSRSWPR